MEFFSLTVIYLHKAIVFNGKFNFIEKRIDEHKRNEWIPIDLQTLIDKFRLMEQN